MELRVQTNLDDQPTSGRGERTDRTDGDSFEFFLGNEGLDNLRSKVPVLCLSTTFRLGNQQLELAPRSRWS